MSTPPRMAEPEHEGAAYHLILVSIALLLGVCIGVLAFLLYSRQRRHQRTPSPPSSTQNDPSKPYYTGGHERSAEAKSHSAGHRKKNDDSAEYSSPDLPVHQIVALNRSEAVKRRFASTSSTATYGLPYDSENDLGLGIPSSADRYAPIDAGDFLTPQQTQALADTPRTRDDGGGSVQKSSPPTLRQPDPRRPSLSPSSATQLTVESTQNPPAERPVQSSSPSPTHTPTSTPSPPMRTHLPTPLPPDINNNTTTSTSNNNTSKSMNIPISVAAKRTGMPSLSGHGRRATLSIAKQLKIDPRLTIPPPPSDSTVPTPTNNPSRPVSESPSITSTSSTSSTTPAPRTQSEPPQRHRPARKKKPPRSSTPPSSSSGRLDFQESDQI